jgi:hypothetical protein
VLQRRFHGDRTVQATLAQVEDDPETGRALLEEQLRHAPEPDEEIIRAATELLARADPDGTRAGKYNATITGSTGGVVGDWANMNITIGATDLCSPSSAASRSMTRSPSR